LADPGRPTSLTPQLIAELANALRLYPSRADAAVFVGIDPKTFRRWLEQGAEDAEGLHADLLQAVRRAEVQRKGGWIGKRIRPLWRARSQDLPLDVSPYRW
jgi:hypothetical protein